MLDHLARESHGFAFDSVASRLGQARDYVIDVTFHFSPLDYGRGLDLPQMRIEPPIRDLDQPLVKQCLILALFLVTA
jgi:hypothetical protein